MRNRMRKGRGGLLPSGRQIVHARCRRCRRVTSQERVVRLVDYEYGGGVVVTQTFEDLAFHCLGCGRVRGGGFPARLSAEKGWREAGVRFSQGF